MTSKKGDSEFGERLGALLDHYSKSRAEVARDMGTSRAYVSQLTAGSKLVSATTVDMLAETIGVSDAERVDLHRAAAKDAGFRIDLPDDF